MSLTEEPELFSYCLIVAYDGHEYFGWQRLVDKPTIQSILEKAIQTTCGEPVVIQGAGRTDRGVHAEGQVAGFKLSKHEEPDDLERRINEVLPATIRVVGVEEVPSTFHARMSAVGKEYAYLIWNEPECPAEMRGRAWHVATPLQVEPMQEAGALLVGKHDFASFATKAGFKQKSTVREIYEVEIAPCDEVIRFRFRADGFLNHMVRNIVRALTKVGEGRHEPRKILEILEAKNRSAAPGTAPARGLYLMQVFYE